MNFFPYVNILLWEPRGCGTCRFIRSRKRIDCIV